MQLITMPDHDSFIIDTSALLSLESIKLLNEVIQHCNLITTPLVIKELEQFSLHDDGLGNAARAVLQAGSGLAVRQAEIIHSISYLEMTDNELYNLAFTEKIPLVTDDHVLNHHTCKVITVYFSTFFLMYFALIGTLTPAQALKRLERLRELRNWSNNIMYLRTKKGLEQLQ